MDVAPRGRPICVFDFLDDSFQVPFKRQTIRPSVESLHSLVERPRAFSTAFELTVVLTDAFRQFFGGADVIFTSTLQPVYKHLRSRNSTQTIWQFSKLPFPLPETSIPLPETSPT